MLGPSKDLGVSRVQVDSDSQQVDLKPKERNNSQVINES